MTAQPTRILTRHVQLGDQIIICGRLETVIHIEEHERLVYVYTPDDPYDPYLFNDRELVTLVTRPA